MCEITFTEKKYIHSDVLTKRSFFKKFGDCSSTLKEIKARDQSLCFLDVTEVLGHIILMVS